MENKEALDHAALKELLESMKTGGMELSDDEAMGISGGVKAGDEKTYAPGTRVYIRSKVVYVVDREVGRFKMCGHDCAYYLLHQETNPSNTLQAPAYLLELIL